jgi:hypothetical protein
VQAPNLPFDLHVLSMPPAFILSQDQTLHDNCFLRLVRMKVELSQPIETDEHLAVFKRILRIPGPAYSVHPSASFNPVGDLR